MAITTLPIGKPYDYTYGAGNVVNRRIKFEREAGRPDTIKAHIITLPGNDPVTTVNDIIVKVLGAWENRDARLSDLSMEQQDSIFLTLSARDIKVSNTHGTGTLEAVDSLVILQS